MCGSKNPTVPDVMLQKRKCPRCVVERFRMMQLSQMSCSEHFQKGNCPRCVVQKHPLSQMCASIKTAVPDVMLQNRYCPRCHVLNIPKKAPVPHVWFKKNLCPRCVLPKKTLSQMSCSEHFQKGNCPRCEVQKHPLSQMCASIKTAVPDVMLQNRYCPRCHVLNIPKKAPVPHVCVVQKIKARRTRSVNMKITAISTERDLFV
jgi:ribosomal protein S27AE